MTAEKKGHVLFEVIFTHRGKSIERVRVSPSSKEQICLLYAKVDDLRRPEKNKNLFRSRVNTGKGDFTTKESLTPAHILNLQRCFNTRISLPVTLEEGVFKLSSHSHLL